MAREARVEALTNAIDEIKHIVWTPKITLPRLRTQVALALRKLDSE